ncbi:MAG TPA: homoserine kinase [Rugosimonospora sp.]|nr:homoserine kinase [Rugosimonospora sp.]
MVRFAATPVRVRVPATSANLGPGFDALGLALALHDDVVAAVSGAGVRVTVSGEGAGDLACDESHLVLRCMLTAFDLLGGRPPGLAVDCVNRIPQARGLGSSSAAIVAGILAARALVSGGNELMPDRAVLRLATELEGHPDNVAPCLLGGFTISWLESDTGARAARLAPAAGVQPVIFVPEERGLTAHARAALPATVPHRDAARNAGRAALLVHALTAAPDLLLPATEDRLHQDYRAPGAPATAALVAALRAAGIPAVVSGAGPSVLAFDTPGETRAAQWLPEGWRVVVPEIDAQGARVEVDWQHAERDPVAAGRAS